MSTCTVVSIPLLILGTYLCPQKIAHDSSFIGVTAIGKIKDEGFKMVGKNQQGYTKS